MSPNSELNSLLENEISKNDVNGIGWRRGFQQGFACAVSALIQSHGCSTEAEELFRMIGDLSVVDESDLKVFRQSGLIKHRKNDLESPRRHDPCSDRPNET